MSLGMWTVQSTSATSPNTGASRSSKTTSRRGCPATTVAAVDDDVDGERVLQAGVEGVDERAVSRTLPARPDGVHNIAEPDAALRIREAHSAACPEVAEAVEIRSEG